MVLEHFYCQLQQTVYGDIRYVSNTCRKTQNATTTLIIWQEKIGHTLYLYGKNVKKTP